MANWQTVFDPSLVVKAFKKKEFSFEQMRDQYVILLNKKIGELRETYEANDDIYLIEELEDISLDAADATNYDEWCEQMDRLYFWADWDNRMWIVPS